MASLYKEVRFKAVEIGDIFIHAETEAYYIKLDAESGIKLHSDRILNVGHNETVLVGSALRAQLYNM